MYTQLKSRPTTIVWGGILLAIAAIAIVATTGGFDGAGPSTVLWLVVGVGGVLVIGALIGGIARAIGGRPSTGSGTAVGSGTGVGSGTAVGSGSGPSDVSALFSNEPTTEDLTATKPLDPVTHQPID